MLAVGSVLSAQTNTEKKEIKSSVHSRIPQRILERSSVNKDFVFKSSQEGARVESFELSYSKDGYEKTLVSKSNKFTDKMISEIRKMPKNTKIYYSEIRVINTDDPPLKGVELILILK